MQSSHKTVHQVIEVFTILIGPIDNLVINIGNITHIVHIVSTRTEITNHHIKEDHDPSMTNMTEVINSHPADIHVDLSIMDWFEGLLGATLSIVDL